ncbi:MAG: cupin domain-containing protein [Pseudomonadota bacterium]
MKVIAQFPEAKSVGLRDWGEEDLLVSTDSGFMMKRLIIKAGSKGGLQYHRLKDECAYVVSGTLLVRFENESGLIEEKVCEAGSWLHFPPGAVHQEEALSDCVLIEASSKHFNDRVRCEARFGLEQGGGLPTTDLDQITTEI